MLAGCGGTGLTSTTAPVFPTAAPIAYPLLPPTADCTPRTTPVAPRLEVIDRHQVDARTVEVTVRSAALGGVAGVDVLLPQGYDGSGRTRYPVLYLLHGHGEDHRAWTSHDVAAVIGDLKLITVMPDGGYDGFYADWYGLDGDGHNPPPPPAWETFHLRELIPWVDASYPTVAGRSGRAVAGLSMGGFGAMSYAARHPDLFVAAGSFSGIVDPDLDYPNGPAVVALANITDHHPADRCIFGDPRTQDVVWRDHDPTELAAGLAGVSVYLACGDGTPAPPGSGTDTTEHLLLDMNRALDTALSAAQVDHVTDFFSPGTHDWPYWLRDLRAFLPQLTAAFAQPPAAPPVRPFSYRNAAPTLDVWGWTVQASRQATAFTYLDDAGSGGFTVRGSGTVTVRTASLYRPDTAYTVQVDGATTTTVADRDGRIAVSVDLGAPAAPVQNTFGTQGHDAARAAMVRITARP